MRNIAIILLTVIFISCNLNDYKIGSLEHRKLSFNELPLKVREYLSDPPDPVRDSYNELVLIDSKDTTVFSLETVETWIGPWVAHVKLKDNQKNISYKINHDTPAPFIVFESKLYIPDRYDILGGESVYEAKYTEYQLKQ